jgi:hypothetical protein
MVLPHLVRPIGAGWCVVWIPKFSDSVTRTYRFHNIIKEKRIFLPEEESDMILPGSQRKNLISGRIGKVRRREL